MSLLLIFLLLILHWYSSLFFQTVFLHRYCSHKMYDLNQFWEKAMYLLTFLTQGTSFLNPAAYSILHQKHHAYSDKHGDPHSPVMEKNFFKFMLITADKYLEAMNQIDNPPKGIAKIYPVWPAFDKLANGWSLRLIWAIQFPVYYYLLDLPLWSYLLLPIHYLMGPIHGAIVNWCGHKLGYVNFKSDDNSKNTLFIDFLMMGELYQNNHHRFPNNSNFKQKWFEFDVGFFIMKILSKVGVIKLSN